MTSYDEKYHSDQLYWGTTPSELCYRVLKLLPPGPGVKLLDIGCGEGRNAIFFARNGYDVTGFDKSAVGIAKTAKWADALNLSVTALVADLREYRLDQEYAVLFSTGTLHYAPPQQRREIIDNFKKHTRLQGLNAFSVFVEKPFVPRAPDAESSAFHWRSGELLGFYHDWLIEYSEESIFECNSGGVPHRHAVNRIVARKV